MIPNASLVGFKWMLNKHTLIIMLFLFRDRCVAACILKHLGNNQQTQKTLRSVCKNWRNDALHSLGWKALVPKPMTTFALEELLEVWRVVRFRDFCHTYNKTPAMRENANVMNAIVNGHLCSIDTFVKIVSSPSFEFAEAAITVFESLVPKTNNLCDPNVAQRMAAFSWFWQTWFPGHKCNSFQCLDAAHTVGILTERERNIFSLVVNDKTFNFK